MTRYNIFNQIHKGLRAMLYDAALALQQTNFADADEAAHALDKVQVAVDLFDSHAHHENSFILPAIQAYEPDTVLSFEEEHGEDHALAQKLRGLIGAYQHAISTDGKLETGLIINVSFVEFMAFNLEHMAREEKVLNRILWKYYSDADLMAISRSIISTLAPEEANISSAWMIRGLNNDELLAWFRAVEKSAPEPVFSNLFAMAEKILPANRFEQLVNGLTEGALLVS